jgi:glycerol kinase
LLTTVAWQLEDCTEYALEGSVFAAGAVIQWLRDGLQLIPTAAASETVAAEVPDTHGVYVVPAFVGLGAPYWDPYARGTIVGLSRGVTRAHLVRAALEAMAYQTRDVLEAMQPDLDVPVSEVRVDGGGAANTLLLQFQADILGVPIVRTAVPETTARGAAYLAGLAVGVWKNREEIAGHWRDGGRFLPRMPPHVGSSYTVGGSVRWNGQKPGPWRAHDGPAGASVHKPTVSVNETTQVKKNQWVRLPIIIEQFEVCCLLSFAVFC